MVTQDRLWKAIIQENFDEFLRYFFKEYVDQINFDKGFDFLDKELQKLFPESEQKNRRADVFAKVHLKDGSECWVLVHVEVQGYKDHHFAERIFTYAYRGMDRFKVKVATLAILTDADKEWRPDRFEYEILGTIQCFKFPLFKLADYEWEDFEDSDNIFAIVMQTALLGLNKNWDDEQLLAMKLKLVARLRRRGYKRERIAGVLNFIKYYVKFENKENYRKFEVGVEKITKTKASKVMTVVETVIDAFKEAAQKEGRQEGRKEGLQEGRQEGEERSTLFFTQKLIKRFPDWTDEEIASLIDRPVGYVKKVRKQMKKKLNGKKSPKK